MKIAIYIGQLGLGGAEKQVALLREGLEGRGHEVLVITSADQLFDGVAGTFGSRLAAIPRKPKRARWSSLKRVLRSYRPDVLHNQLGAANFWGTCAAKAARVPAIIISYLSTDPGKKRHQVVLDRYLAIQASGIHVNSERVKERYVRIVGNAARKIKVIYNGVDASRFDRNRYANDREAIRIKDMQIPAEAPAIINVANLYRVKNHALLIKALVEIHAKCAPGKRPYLVLLGAGPEKQNILNAAASSGLLPYLRIIGRVTDPERYLAASDIFVLNSDVEGFSNALLEAMASSLPCVATDVGGNAEALGPDTGTVTPPRDPEALAAALNRLLENKNVREGLGAEARRRVVELFGVERMVDETEAWYRTLLRGVNSGIDS